MATAGEAGGERVMAAGRKGAKLAEGLSCGQWLCRGPGSCGGQLAMGAWRGLRWEGAQGSQELRGHGHLALSPAAPSASRHRLGHFPLFWGR